MNDTIFKQLKIVSTEPTMVWSYCCFHKDTERPNLSISLLDDYYGRYKCWACGKEGRLSTKQMKGLAVSKKKRIKPISIDWNRLTEEYFKRLSVINNIKLLDLWNINSNSIWQFRGGWDGEAYTFPMKSMVGSGLCITGIQRVWLDSRKKAIHGSQLGLFIPSNNNNDRSLFIVEGISDAVSVDDLGLAVIGKPCATYGDKIIKELLLEFDISSVIVIPDNDEAGCISTQKLVKVLSGIVNISVFEFEGAKDIREYIFLKGKDAVKQELLRYI